MTTTSNLRRLAELLAQEAHANGVSLADHVAASASLLTPERRAEILAMTSSLNPGDRITARIFGQNLTMQRCEWDELAESLKVGTDLAVRVTGIALRDADAR